MNGIELKIARMRRNISSKDAGEILGINVAHYSHRERGRVAFSTADVVVLSNALNLSFEEFVTVFFDGDFAFSVEDKPNHQTLKECRIAAKMNQEEAAKLIGVTTIIYSRKECGKLSISLKQCTRLVKGMKMSFRECNDIFFESKLPYRNSDALSYYQRLYHKDGEE